jgi:Flp pilus assembly protein CpaB
MQAPVRPNRARASGGRTLILLGVLLALAAGAIVIFVVSTAGGGPLAATETVIVATQDIPAGAILTTGAGQNCGPQAASAAGNAGPITCQISTVFVAKSVNTDFAPKNAYIFKSQNDLNTLLNNEVVSGNFYAGEILRQSDPRLTAAGQGAPGSMTSLNPGKLPNGSVLAEIPLSTKPAVVPGDIVDVLATDCSIPSKQGKCETQTTLQNVYVYAVSGNTVFVVLKHQEAVTALFLTNNASNYELVIRKPGDNGNITTTPVDSQSIASQFGY